MRLWTRAPVLEPRFGGCGVTEPPPPQPPPPPPPPPDARPPVVLDFFLGMFAVFGIGVVVGLLGLFVAVQSPSNAYGVLASLVPIAFAGGSITLAIVMMRRGRTSFGAGVLVGCAVLPLILVVACFAIVYAAFNNA